MGLFKTERDKLIERQEAARLLEQEQQENEYLEAVKRIVIFPGTMQQYEELVQHKVQVIDNGLANKGIHLKIVFHQDYPGYEMTNYDLTGGSAVRNRLINEGLEAIVSACFTQMWDGHWGYLTNTYYGLPVSKKSV